MGHRVSHARHTPGASLPSRAHEQGFAQGGVPSVLPGGLLLTVRSSAQQRTEFHSHPTATRPSHGCPVLLPLTYIRHFFPTTNVESIYV